MKAIYFNNVSPHLTLLLGSVTLSEFIYDKTNFTIG